MKSKRILKIILLVIGILLTGFISVLMYVVCIENGEPFVYSMLPPLSMIVTGGLSTAYHFKTFKFYSLKTSRLFIKETVLWVGNALFTLSIILMALYLVYKIYEDYKTSDNDVIYIVFIIIVIMLVFGISLAIEALNIYRRVIKSNKDLFKASIDDIGNSEVKK